WIGLGVAVISVAPYADIVLTGLALYPAVRGLVWVYGNIGRIQASRSETSPSAPLKAVVAPPPDDPKTCADMEKQGLESPCSAKKRKLQETKIGRASCRERGKNTVGAGRLEKECE